MAETGDLTQDNTTNNPPVEVVLPVPPDAAVLEHALRNGENKKFIEGVELWIASVDRIPAEIKDSETAGKVAKTIAELVKGRTNAEKIHAAAKKPWLDVGRVFDGVFLNLGKRALEAQKKAETVQKKYLLAEEKKSRDAAEAAARRADEEATRLREEEEARLRQAERAQDSGDMEGANTLLNQAAEASEAATAQEGQAQTHAAKAEAPMAEQVRTHHNIGVTTSAKKFWTAELLPLDGLNQDQQLAFWKALAPYIAPADRLKAAKAAVKAGLRECPGIKIFEDFNPINR